ncbi:CBS domain-containing protein [Litorilituus sediminis]|uniref:CBS domain-containing protein n=1 Tax=Litorilituus sediminis TaxID=718192 RepID=A0A4V0ZGJ2_9GAMM|nr:CBS domain-containing protein [Litorilituus sediminis]QBG37490.1 CBS domain-containing protein [Litorilituus sediminis]
MKIESLMSTKLVTLHLDDDLSKAKDVFNTHNIHHILILDDDNKLAGVITDRDLFKHLSPTVGTSKESPKDISLMQRKMHQIMSRELISAKKEQSLNEAVLLFHDNHISCLPVTNEQGKAIGIITWRDILKVIALQYRKKIKQSG